MKKYIMKKIFVFGETLPYRFPCHDVIIISLSNVIKMNHNGRTFDNNLYVVLNKEINHIWQ